MIKIFLKFFFTYLLYFTIIFFFIIISDTKGSSNWDLYLFMFGLSVFSSIIFSLFSLVKYLKKIKKHKNKKFSKQDHFNLDAGGNLDAAPGDFIFIILSYIYSFFSKKTKKGENGSINKV